MAQTFTFTSPGIFAAALGLIQTAAEAWSDQPPLLVVPFELGSYEPANYITVHDITKINLTIEDTSYAHQEHYDLEGEVVVFTGDSPFGPNQAASTVATDVMNTAWSIYQTYVISPLISNRNQPILGATPTPYQMLLKSSQYNAGVGHTKDGQPWGWEGIVSWAVHFDAYVAPQTV